MVTFKQFVNKVEETGLNIINSDSLTVNELAILSAKMGYETSPETIKQYFSQYGDLTTG